MVVDPGLTDEKRMPRSRRAKILIQGKRIIDWSRCKLAVKTQVWIEIGVKVQTEAITGPHILQMCECWIRRVGCGAQTRIHSQTEIATQTKRTNPQYLTFNLGQSLF